MKATPRSATRASAAVDTAEAAKAFGSTVGEIWKSMSGLSLPLPAVSRMQADYLKQATDLWNQNLKQGDAAPPPAPGDKRFAAQDWLKNPASAYIAQMYLLNARTLMEMADAVEGDAKTRQRIR